MKTKDEKKALLKQEDKIDELETAIEIEWLQREKNKEKNKYCYSNEYYFVYGKKKINYERINEE